MILPLPLSERCSAARRGTKFLGRRLPCHRYGLLWLLTEIKRKWEVGTSRFRARSCQSLDTLEDDGMSGKSISLLIPFSFVPLCILQRKNQKQYFSRFFENTPKSNLLPTAYCLLPAAHIVMRVEYRQSSFLFGKHLPRSQCM